MNDGGVSAEWEKLGVGGSDSDGVCVCASASHGSIYLSMLLSIYLLIHLSICKYR